MSRDNNNSGRPKKPRSSTRNSDSPRAPKSGNSSDSKSFKKPFSKTGGRSFGPKDRNENGPSKFEKKPFSRSDRDTDTDSARPFKKPDSKRSDTSYESRMEKKYSKVEKEPFVSNQSEERKSFGKTNFKRGGEGEAAQMCAENMKEAA